MGNPLLAAAFSGAVFFAAAQPSVDSVSPQNPGDTVPGESKGVHEEGFEEPGYCCTAVNYTPPVAGVACPSDAHPSGLWVCPAGVVNATKSGATCIVGMPEELCVTEPVDFLGVPTYSCVEHVDTFWTLWSLIEETPARVWVYCSWDATGATVTVAAPTMHCATKKYLCR